MVAEGKGSCTSTALFGSIGAKIDEVDFDGETGARYLLDSSF